MSDNQPEMTFVPKGWGYEKWIVNKKEYCGKLLFFVKGKKCSLHSHKIKDEVFYVQSGHIMVSWTDDLALAEEVAEADKKDLNLWPMLNCTWLTKGDNFHIPTGRVHRMTALEDTELFEFSTQHFDSDSYRILKGD